MSFWVSKISGNFFFFPRFVFASEGFSFSWHWLMSCSIASLGRPFSVFQTNGETQKGEKKKFSKLTFSKCHCVPVKDGMIDFERGKKA